MKNIEILQKVADLVGFKFSSTHAFAEVELVGGVRITNSTEGDFLVGDTISVLNDDGTSSVVGEGIHELLDGRVFLTDTEGKLVEIRESADEADTEGAPGSTEAGVEMEEVEVEVPDMVADVMTPDVVEAVVEALTPIVEELKVLTEEMKKMKKDYEDFKASSAYTPVNEDKRVSSAFSDHRYEVLKAMKKSMK